MQLLRQKKQIFWLALLHDYNMLWSCCRFLIGLVSVSDCTFTSFEAWFVLLTLCPCLGPWQCGGTVCSTCADKVAVLCKWRVTSTSSWLTVWTESVRVMSRVTVPSTLLTWKHGSQGDFTCALPISARCLILSRQNWVSTFFLFCVNTLFSAFFFKLQLYSGHLALLLTVFFKIFFLYYHYSSGSVS